MRHGTFAYTWDIVGDPGAAARIAGLGVDTVVLQAAYHAVRAITPWHPRHRIVHAEHAAAYFALRPERWRGLRPLAPAWGVDVPDRFGEAAAALSAEGLRVEAWLVLTHSSALGRTAPELTVRNAYGEHYLYALCPSHEQVRDYARTLVAEVCEQYDVAALMLEACGWLGFEHGSHHEKTAGADLSPSARALLSICFCPACRAAIGPEADALQRDVRAAVDAELRHGTPAHLADERMAPVFAHRSAVITDLVRQAATPAGEREILLMAADDPWVTGPDVGVDLAAFHGPADAFVLKCWGDQDAALSQVKAAASRTSVPLVANVSVLEELPDSVSRLAGAGAKEIRYYHAGLASAARLDWLRAAVQQEET